MTDTPTLIAEAMHKLAKVFDERKFDLIATAVREAFPIEFDDDGPNGLGGVISPDDASKIPVREDKKEKADKNGRLPNGYFLVCLVSDSICKQECLPGECKRGSANQTNKPAPAAPDDLPLPNMNAVLRKSVEVISSPEKPAPAESMTKEIERLLPGCSICGKPIPVGLAVKVDEGLWGHHHCASKELSRLRAEIARLTAPVTDEEVQKILATMQYAQTARNLIERLARSEREAKDNLAKIRDAEHALSAAYVRVRAILGAFDTPHAPSAEQIWSHTEEKARQVIERAESAERRRTEAVKALGPFAKVAADYAAAEQIRVQHYRDEGREHGKLLSDVHRVSVSLGECRTALATLSPLKGDGG